MTWTVETLSAIVDAEIAALPRDMQPAGGSSSCMLS
jgi:hypothetical protein